MDTEAVTGGGLCLEMDARKLIEFSKDVEAKLTASNLSDSDSNNSADVSQNHFTTFVGTTKKRCRLTQRSNPSWRRSGRRWQPTSVFKRDQTLPRRRPPSSTDTDSCERPSVRGRLIDLKLSDSDNDKSEDERQNSFTTFVETTKKRCRLTQRSNPSWRRSGRRWHPTSVFKRDQTPPRRRPPSSTDTDSCDRPAVRGRSRVRKQPKLSKKRALIQTAVKALLLGKNLGFGDHKNHQMLSTDTDSCVRPASRGRSRVLRSPKLSK